MKLWHYFDLSLEKKSFTVITSITAKYAEKSMLKLFFNYVCNPNIITTNIMFFPEPPDMPLGTPAPLNKRKKLAKIITDLSHITQDGKAGMKLHEYETKSPYVNAALSYKDRTHK